MRLLITLVLLVLAAASSTPARADDRADAAREFAAGEAADERGDFRAAIALYKRAHQRVPHHFTAYNIAVDHERLGEYREAAAWFTRYLEMAPGAKDRDAVERAILALKLKPAQLTVTSRPPGARVTIDNQVVGITPLVKAVRGGGHRVAVEMGDQRESRDIVLVYGEPETVEVVLRATPAVTPKPTTTTTITRSAPASTAGATGTLAFTGTPVGATVTIDDEVVGTVPIEVEVPIGDHAIQVASFGYAPLETTISVSPNTSIPVAVQLQPPTEGGVPPGVIQASYLIGTGGGFGLRGEGSMWLAELGVRARRFDFSARIGKQDELTVIDLLVRWSLFDTRLSPFVGLGYFAVASRDDGASGTGSGGLLLGGLRYDLARGEHAGVSLTAETGLRPFSGVTISKPGEAPQTISGVFVPLMLSFQVMYGRGR